MGDNANQNKAENVQHLQQSRPRISINPQIRQRVIFKIISFLRNHSKEPGKLSGVEAIARKYEGKIIAIASDEKDYLRRITSKITTLEDSFERSDSSPAFSATTASNQLHSASSENVQHVSIKHDQQQVQTQGSSQLRPCQIINSCSTAMNSTVQHSGSHFPNQSSNLLGISSMPPNFEKKAPGQLAPSSLLPISSRPGQIEDPQLLQRNHIRPSIQVNVGHQNTHKQLPCSQQVACRPVASGPTTPSEQPEVSSGYRHESVTKQRYESWQRDIAHQRKSVPSQQKSMLGKHETSREQSSAFNNQQNVSQPSRAHNVVEQQPSVVANIPQRSLAESTTHEGLKRQNVKPHDVPMIQSHAPQISQRKVEVVREEKNHSSSVGLQTIQSRSLPPEASKRIDTSVAMERHGDMENWREGIHQKIIAMKNEYQADVVEWNARINEKLKLLDTHPNDPNRDIYLKKYQEVKIVLARIFKILTLPKESIMPVHAEKVEQWEKYIATYLNSTSKPKPAIPPSLPSLPPQIHKPRVRPMEDVRNVKSQPAQNPTSISPSPVLVECNDVDTNLRNNSQIITSEQTSTNQSPIERLLKAVSSISPQALKSGIDDIFSVTSMGDVMDSAAPRPTSETTLLPLGQDLGAMTGCRLQARNVMSLHNGGNGGVRTWTPRPQLLSSTLLDTCDTESTSESHWKRRRVDHPHLLLSEEIRKVNQRLIDVVVEICKEEVSDVLELLGKSCSGTVVKCCYVGVSAILGFMKSVLSLGISSLIQSLYLLVPTNYPDCSPIILDKPPSESIDGNEDLSNKARARLDLFLRGFDSAFSVSDVAKKWELCARDVIIEHAEKFGGGTFRSKYGTWENCLDFA